MSSRSGLPATLHFCADGVIWELPSRPCRATQCCRAMPRRSSDLPTMSTHFYASSERAGRNVRLLKSSTAGPDTQCCCCPEDGSYKREWGAACMPGASYADMGMALYGLGRPCQLGGGLGRVGWCDVTCSLGCGGPGGPWGHTDECGYKRGQCRSELTVCSSSILPVCPFSSAVDCTSSAVSNGRTRKDRRVLLRCPHGAHAFLGMVAVSGAPCLPSGAIFHETGRYTVPNVPHE